MTEQAQDNPGVVVFPPIILLATVALGVILDWFLPLGLLAHLPWTPRMVAGATLLVLGASMPFSVRRAFVSAGINIHPDMPTTALVTSGLFAHTRNPVYVGGIVALLGVAFLIGSDWILLLLVLAFLLLHYGVVLREEVYLEKKFGAPYRDYLESVPRYGWKF
jgi:protein-S-isoprenylcysteine O-methyltransferase Ste14